jgi:hypothetical protein
MKVGKLSALTININILMKLVVNLMVKPVIICAESSWTIQFLSINRVRFLVTSK